MAIKSEIKFLNTIPVLASDDIKRDIDWYETKLGFKNVYDSSNYKEGPLDYAVIQKQHLFLHIQFQYTKDLVTTRADIKFVVQNIEALFEDYVSKGLLDRSKIHRHTDWNTTEFGLKDLSGNRITFFEDL